MLAKVVSAVLLLRTRFQKTSLLKIDSFWFCQSDQQNTPEHFLREANLETLPTAQRTEGIEYFDSFYTFSSKQKL